MRRARFTIFRKLTVRGAHSTRLPSPFSVELGEPGYVVLSIPIVESLGVR